MSGITIFPYTIINRRKNDLYYIFYLFELPNTSINENELKPNKNYHYIPILSRRIHLYELYNDIYNTNHIYIKGLNGDIYKFQRIKTILDIDNITDIDDTINILKNNENIEYIIENAHFYNVINVNEGNVYKREYGLELTVKLDNNCYDCKEYENIKSKHNIFPKKSLYYYNDDKTKTYNFITNLNQIINGFNLLNLLEFVGTKDFINLLYRISFLEFRDCSVSLDFEFKYKKEYRQYFYDLIKRLASYLIVNKI